MRGMGRCAPSYSRLRAGSAPAGSGPGAAGVLDALPRLRAVPAGTSPAARGRAAKAAAALAERWRPWRSYAVHHLWACLEGGAREDSAREDSAREDSAREDTARETTTHALDKNGAPCPTRPRPPPPA